MHFGAWIRQLRAEKNLDLQTLAQKARLNASSISRIENQALNPTIDTTVQLLQALDATPFDLYLALSDKDKNSYPKMQQSPLINTAPTRDDVITFERFAEDYPKYAKVFLAKWLNKVYETHHPHRNIWENGFFQAEDMAKLFHNSPIYIAEIDYPVDLKADAILDIHRQKGAIVRQDAYIYLKYKNKFKFPKPIPSRMSMALFSKLRYPLQYSIFQRVKLADLFFLDKFHEDEGTLFVIYLQAIEFEFMVNPRRIRRTYSGEYRYLLSNWRSVEKFKAGYNLLMLHRWMKYLDFNTPNWLRNLREEMAAAGKRIE